MIAIHGRAVPRPVAVGVLAVVLAGGAGGCVPDDVELTAEDARTFTREALEAAGVEDVRVVPEVQAGVHRPARQPDRRVPVWETQAAVEGGRVELHVLRRGDQAVYLQDLTPAGDQLLTSDQFELLEDYRSNPAADRLRARQAPRAVAAGVLAALAAAAIAAVVVLDRSVRGEVLAGVRATRRWWARRISPAVSPAWARLRTWRPRR